MKYGRAAQRCASRHAQVCVSCADVLQVDSNGGLEQRLSSLEAQIDALRHGTPDEGQPLEHRLSSLVDYSAAILKQWSATADRHARAVGQLESQLRELGDAGTRLQHDTAQRLQ